MAIATLVPTTTWGGSGSSTIQSTDFCNHMPLSTDLLGAIFGLDTANPLTKWSDPRIDCPSTSSNSAIAEPISAWANLDPSSANFALISLLDSTPSSQADLQAGLNNGSTLTTSTTASTDRRMRQIPSREETNP